MKKLKTQKRLLERKLTSYRKAAVMKLKNLVTESAEADRKGYQENLMSTRNTDVKFKHLKSLNKSPNLPKQIVSGHKVSTIVHEQVDIINEFFHSIFSPKQPFINSDIKTKNPTLTNFNISVETIHSFVSGLDITKSRGPNGLPPDFFKKTSRQISVVLNKLMKVIKKQRRIPDTWRTAAVTPIHKKGDRRYVQNYRPVSLLNTEGKILEKCIYVALYHHFSTFLTKHQHGFVKNQSVFTNMITFLTKIHDALDNDPNSEVIAFYTDFSKAFDKVPHFELLKKVANIGVGGCLPQILMDCLSNRKQFVRIDKTCSCVRDVDSGVPQVSLLGPLLFRIFINDLPEALKFTGPFILADDLKILAIGKDHWTIQEDLDSIATWVRSNKMELALCSDNISRITFRG